MHLESKHAYIYLYKLITSSNFHWVINWYILYSKHYYNLYRANTKNSDTLQILRLHLVFLDKYFSRWPT